MTQVFDSVGNALPATVLAVEKGKVTKHLSQGDKVTHIEVGYGAKRNPIKADAGNYAKLGYVPAKAVTVKVAEGDQIAEVGTDVNVDIYQVGDKVKVTGVTKGKGFQGVVKRHGFHGGPKTHGQSDRQRAPGSIGSGTTLGRVFKGTKMGGHMGNVQRTVSNLKVVDVDAEKGLLVVAGSLPGKNGALVVVKKMNY